MFGAPLAMEALLAFFLESTFIGLWIFGWNKLSPRLHLATIWLAAIGTSLSAFFILAANSWMQHPVGYRVDPVTHRVQLTSIWALLTNSTVLAPGRTCSSPAFLMAGAVMSRPAPGTWPGSDSSTCSAGPCGSAWSSRWSPGSPPPSPATSRPG